jgi:hypothetical protein
MVIYIYPKNEAGPNMETDILTIHIVASPTSVLIKYSAEMSTRETLGHIRKCFCAEYRFKLKSIMQKEKHKDDKAHINDKEVRYLK